MEGMANIASVNTHAVEYSPFNNGLQVSAEHSSQLGTTSSRQYPSRSNDNRYFMWSNSEYG